MGQDDRDDRFAGIISRVISLSELRRLRMLADWQLRTEGYNPMEVVRLCREIDDGQGRPLIDVLSQE